MQGGTGEPLEHNATNLIMLGKIRACSAWSPAGSAVSVFASSNFMLKWMKLGGTAG